MKRPVSLAVVTSILVSMASFGVAHAQTRFNDVPSSSPYYNAVQWLTDNGVIQGYGDGTFRPNNPVNRAEMLKMIFIADGNEDDADAALASAKLFPDTPKSQWYAKYVALARNRGTVQGYPDGYFRPERSINKAEAYKVVLKEFFNETTMSFTLSHGNLPTSGTMASDVKKTDWFISYVNFAGLKNIFEADRSGSTRFYPGHELTRGELADLIYRSKAVADYFPNNIEADSSKYNSKTIPFTVNLYNYNFLESSGKPNFTIADDTHPGALIGYATKYPQSLLTSNGDTTNTLKFLSGTNHDVLDITMVIKQNANKLSFQEFYKNEKLNYFNEAMTHEDIMVNGLPAIWFHKVGDAVDGTDEVVVVQFNNAIAEITDLKSRHQLDGVFNYMVYNFWFKNFSV